MRSTFQDTVCGADFLFYSGWLAGAFFRKENPNQKQHYNTGRIKGIAQGINKLK